MIMLGPRFGAEDKQQKNCDRDNALYLMIFLQSHLFLLPQICSSVPHRLKDTYKEMSSITDTLDDLDVRNWTNLDYAAVTHRVYSDISFQGSIFQTLVNS